MKVSQSRVKLWRKCHRAHWYRYVLRLEKKVKPLPLFNGTLIHEMLDRKINGEDPLGVIQESEASLKGFFDEEVMEHREAMVRAPSVIDGYFKFYRDDGLTYLRGGEDKKKTELRITIPLREGVEFIFVLDGLVKDKNKRIWIKETKTCKKIPDEDVRMNDIQSVMYAWALQQYGELPTPDGILWDYIRTKPPTLPQALKSGELSKKAIDTTWAVYRRAIRELGLKESDYKDMKEKLEGAEANYYRRIPLPFNQSVVESVVRDFHETVSEIIHLGDKAKSRTTDKHCSWCNYRDICQAELMGLDVDFIMNKNFKEREDAGEEEKNREA